MPRLNDDIFKNLTEDYFEIFSYLGVKPTGNYFPCPYCSDKKKKKNKQTALVSKLKGNQVFLCFKCEKRGNIVDLIQSELTLEIRNKKELVAYLKFKYPNFDPINDLKDRMSHGSTRIPEVGECREPADPMISLSGALPIVCPAIGNVAFDLLTSEIIKTLCTLETYLRYRKSHIDKWGVFFISQKYLSQKTGLVPGTCSRILNMLCYLGILEKIPFDKVPVGLYQKTAKGGSINFFRLPLSTTPEVMESRLRGLKAAGINRKNWSAKKLEQAFGESEAKRVYPDYFDYDERQALKEKSEFFSMIPVLSDEEIEAILFKPAVKNKVSFQEAIAEARVKDRSPALKLGFHEKWEAY